MKRLLQLELKKALKNRLFVLSVSIMTLFAVLSAVYIRRAGICLENARNLPRCPKEVIAAFPGNRKHAAHRAAAGHVSKSLEQPIEKIRKIIFTAYQVAL